jgi:hypothetical protein
MVAPMTGKPTCHPSPKHTACGGRRIPVQVGLIIMYGVAALAIAACYVSRVDWAKQRVAVGGAREPAVSALATEAWYHAECPYENGVEDLFFYGDHRFDEAEIVAVESRCVDEVCRITRIGGFEPYLWHSVYADCYDRSRFGD